MEKKRMYYYNLDQLIRSTGYYRNHISQLLCLPNYTLSKVIHSPELQKRNLARLRQLLVYKLKLFTGDEFDTAAKNTVEQNERRHKEAARGWECEVSVTTA
jgi:hypothetical protein